MTDLNIARSSSLLDTANRALKACDVADYRIMYHMVAMGLSSMLLSWLTAEQLARFRSEKVGLTLLGYSE